MSPWDPLAGGTPAGGPFYTYVHRNPVTNEVFYVGKGKGERAWNILNRNKVHRRIIDDLHKQGFHMGELAEIIRGGLSEPEAKELEASLIRVFHKDNLANDKQPNGGMSKKGKTPLTVEITRKFISSIPDLARGTTYYGRYLKVNAGVTGRIAFYARLNAGGRTITEKLGSCPDRDGITDREIEELQEGFDSRVGTLLALREQGKL